MDKHDHLLIQTPDRNAAIVRAYATGGYFYQQIVNYFKVHFATIVAYNFNARPLIFNPVILLGLNVSFGNDPLNTTIRNEPH